MAEIGAREKDRLLVDLALSPDAADDVDSDLLIKPIELEPLAVIKVSQEGLGISSVL